jgi:hypothetical protein
MITRDKAKGEVMKLSRLLNDTRDSRTIHVAGTPRIFENGKATQLTAGADVHTDENSREECLDGPLVVARD